MIRVNFMSLKYEPLQPSPLKEISSRDLGVRRIQGIRTDIEYIDQDSGSEGVC
jgi:hypothetical protein